MGQNVSPCGCPCLKWWYIIYFKIYILIFFLRVPWCTHHFLCFHRWCLGLFFLLPREVYLYANNIDFNIMESTWRKSVVYWMAPYIHQFPSKKMGGFLQL
jgi:hypothetical protein